MKPIFLIGVLLIAHGSWSSEKCDATDWPQFRGGIAQGVVAGINTSNDLKIAWKEEVPGSGWSQPIVFGKTIYLTTAVADPPIVPKNFARGVADPRSMPSSKAVPPDSTIAWKVVALNLESGTTLWSAIATTGKPKYAIHPSNTYATETPAADSAGVYAFFGATGTAAAFDHAGKMLWTRELGAHPTDENFGTASSPVLHESKLYLQCFNKDQAYVVCLNAKTGEENWRINRDTAGSSWSTPLVWKNNLRTELIVSGQKLMTSHDPATGDELWRIAGINMPSTASVTSRVDAIFFGYRSPFSAGPLYAVEAGGRGDLSPPAGSRDIKLQRWAKAGAAPGMPTPIVVGDLLYILNNSLLTCHNALTGEVHYKQRLPGMATVAASPVAIGNHLIVIDEKGTILPVVIGPAFAADKPVELNDVVWSSPAVAAGHLLVRGVEHLTCMTE